VIVTVLSLVVLPSTGFRTNSVRKALFNYTHWTVLWTILFVYSIQVSAFGVLFGQFFKRRKIKKRHSLVNCIYLFCISSIASKTTWVFYMGNNIY
jgi:hypothetical protein